MIGPCVLSSRQPARRRRGLALMPRLWLNGPAARRGTRQLTDQVTRLKRFCNPFLWWGTLVRVYGAIIFVLENQEKVEAYLRDQERLWAEVKTRETGLPAVL